MNGMSYSEEGIDEFHIQLVAAPGVGWGGLSPP